MAENIKDCNENTYFYGGPCAEAIFENRQKRNFIDWMKEKISGRLDGQVNDDQKQMVYLGDTLTPFSTESIYVQYQDGILYRTDMVELAEDNKQCSLKTDIYLDADEKFLIEKIIETKNKKMMQEVVKAVKKGFSKKDVADLHEKYVQYRAKKIHKILDSKNSAKKEKNRKPKISNSTAIKINELWEMIKSANGKNG